MLKASLRAASAPAGVVLVQGPESGLMGHPPGPAGVRPLLAAAWGSLRT